jgi:hypothetical protein
MVVYWPAPPCEAGIADTHLCGAKESMARQYERVYQDIILRQKQKR